MAPYYSLSLPSPPYYSLSIPMTPYCALSLPVVLTTSPLTKAGPTGKRPGCRWAPQNLAVPYAALRAQSSAKARRSSASGRSTCSAPPGGPTVPRRPNATPPARAARSRRFGPAQSNRLCPHCRRPAALARRSQGPVAPPSRLWSCTPRKPHARWTLPRTLPRASSRRSACPNRRWSSPSRNLRTGSTRRPRLWP